MKRLLTRPRTCEQNKQMEALGSPTEPHILGPEDLLLFVSQLFAIN
jgi:hypothetical protein